MRGVDSAVRKSHSTNPVYPRQISVGWRTAFYTLVPPQYRPVLWNDTRFQELAVTSCQHTNKLVYNVYRCAGGQTSPEKPLRVYCHNKQYTIYIFERKGTNKNICLAFCHLLWTTVGKNPPNCSCASRCKSCDVAPVHTGEKKINRKPRNHASVVFHGPWATACECAWLACNRRQNPEDDDAGKQRAANRLISDAKKENGGFSFLETHLVSLQSSPEWSACLI